MSDFQAKFEEVGSAVNHEVATEHRAAYQRRLIVTYGSPFNLSKILVWEERVWQSSNSWTSFRNEIIKQCSLE